MNKSEAPEQEPVEKRTGKIADVDADLDLSKNKPKETPKANVRMIDGVEVVYSNVRTNSSGYVTEKILLADGKKVERVIPPKPIFENVSDQVIALAISTKPGDAMPPLPDISGIDEEFMNSLLIPIRINDDDSDEVKEIKARVMETRAYLVQEVKDGGSVYEALMEHQREMQNMADSRIMALMEVQKIQEEYGDEMAMEFAEKVNESFRIRGIPEIPAKKYQ